MSKLKHTNFSYLILILALFFYSCSSSNDEGEYSERSVEEIYNSALNELESKNYIGAAREFEDLERQHPYSAWAKQAQIMTAYARYLRNDYNEAIAAAQRYIELHPGADDIDYAYYLVAISYYERISDVKREQSMTKIARDSFNELIRRFPDSTYARDSRQKLFLVLDHLAGKDMEVGRTYLSFDNYVAAINRFKSVVENYPNTSHVPEALARLTEVYFKLGVFSEAKASAAVLGHNFPENYWYKYTYKLLSEYKNSSNSDQIENINIEDSNISFLDEILSIFEGN